MPHRLPRRATSSVGSPPHVGFQLQHSRYGRRGAGRDVLRDRARLEVSRKSLVGIQVRIWQVWLKICHAIAWKPGGLVALGIEIDVARHWLPYTSSGRYGLMPCGSCRERNVEQLCLWTTECTVYWHKLIDSIQIKLKVGIGKTTDIKNNTSNQKQKKPGI